MPSRRSRVVVSWIRYFRWADLIGRRASSKTVLERRRLGIEPLEQRAMLAANPLGSISGLVVTDLTGNGVTGDDPKIGGASVQLYQDTGNGIYGAEDTLLGSATSDVNGKYAFNNLAAGTYHVKHTAAAGYIQKPGSNVATVVISAGQALGSDNITIDSFDNGKQKIEADSDIAMSASGSTSAAGILGGERDLSAQLSSTTGAMTLSVNRFNRQVLEFSSTFEASGTNTITWDGSDNSSVLNPTGLGGVDLTSNGANTGLRFNVGADLPGGSVTIRIYSNATNWSTASVSIPQTGSAARQQIVVPFSSFSTGGGSGATLTSVGAIQMDITGSMAIDGQIDQLTAFGPTVIDQNFADYVPLSLGDLVWNDANNSGAVDGGEQGIANVSLNAYLDTDGSSSLTSIDTLVGSTTTNSSGNYLFSNLFPGSYIVQVAASNFSGSGALVGYQSSTGNQPTPSPDNDVNNDDNGDAASGQGIVAKPVTLTTYGEPVTDGDSSNLSNLSVDFGVFQSLVDLAITKEATPTTTTPGNVVTYSMNVTNNGPIAATGVIVTDTLPAGVTFVAAAPSEGTVQSTANGTVVVAMGNFAVGQTKTLIITASINNGVSGTLINNVHVAGNETETTYTNNDASAPVTVNLPPPPQASPAAISGFVYVDLNNNGIMDSGETPIAGVTVRLVGGNGVNTTTTTASDGSYQFTGLTGGVYGLIESQPTAYRDGLDTAGSLGGTATNDAINNVTLLDGANGTNYNFGERLNDPSKLDYIL